MEDERDFHRRMAALGVMAGLASVYGYSRGGFAPASGRPSRRLTWLEHQAAEGR